MRIESAPSAGPTVRSSSIATGIGSEPERSTTARSAASCVVKRPSIWPRDADPRLDVGRAVDAIVEHDRELVADVFSGEIAEDLTALAVELELDDRPLLAVEADARVLEMVAGDVGAARAADRR